VNGLSHPWSRLAGLIVGAAVMFILDPSRAGSVHQLWLPLCLAVAAYLMTRALWAVSFATFALSAVNTNLGSADWISAFAYPAIATLSMAACLALAARRFRQRIASTHDARWKNRGTVGDDTGDQAR